MMPRKTNYVLLNVYATCAAGIDVPKQRMRSVLLGGRQRSGVREHTVPEDNACSARPSQGLLSDPTQM